MRAHEYFRASFRYNDFRIIVVIPQSPGPPTGVVLRGTIT